MKEFHTPFDVLGYFYHAPSTAYKGSALWCSVYMIHKVFVLFAEILCSYGKCACLALSLVGSEIFVANAQIALIIRNRSTLSISPTIVDVLLGSILRAFKREIFPSGGDCVRF